jgi:hypothetical protein
VKKARATSCHGLFFFSFFSSLVFLV